MTNDKGSPNARTTKERAETSSRHSDLVIPSDFDIRHSSFSEPLITTTAQLSELLKSIEPAERVAIDTEADSLHCYREKLCLLQISIRWIGLSEDDAKTSARSAPGLTSRSSLPPGSGAPRESAIHPGEHILRDFIVDPLANLDLAPLTHLLAQKEIVLHGADFDLRLLRRSLGLVPKQAFDTVIAARLIGIREFSLVALVERYFGIRLSKGSQRANWARRPLPLRMEQYAINDTHYLLPLADRLETELDQHDRSDWFRQSCRRALEQSAVSRMRDAGEAWRIPGAGALHGRAAAVLRLLWQWREDEAQAVDRPPFHILQNRELLSAAETFEAGGVPDYKHFSARRRQAFREAAEQALNLPEEEWPAQLRRLRARPSLEIIRRAQELKYRRDRAAKKYDLEASFIASRSALESIAADESCAGTLLVPWQRQLLEIKEKS